MDTPTTSTTEAWTKALARIAADYDLTDADDRASYRVAVQHLASRVRVDLIRSLARHFGAAANVPTTRSAAVRSLADAFAGTNR